MSDTAPAARDLDGHDIQTVVEVVPEKALFDELLQVFVVAATILTSSG